MTDGVHVHTNLQWIIPLTPKLAKLICLARILRGSYIGHPRLGHQYEKLGLPVSYEEAIARLLTLKHLRNLIDRDPRN